MATDIGTAYVQIVPSMNGISGSISSLMAPEASSAGSSSGLLLGTQLLGSLKGALGAAAIAGAVKGLVDGIGSCVTEYANFDEAMSQVAATMGTSKDQITDLSDCAKEMGATTAFSADEAANGLNILAMAGLDADEQMAVLPEVLNLASAGALDLESSASYVTGTIKGFGDSMDNAQYYADLMANGATLANTSVGDLGEALSGSAATANSYGQDVDSVTLSLLKMAEQNVTGSEASTALNRAMADLYTPTSAAAGALDELGVSCYDETGAARDFNDVCDELNDALGGMSEQEQNAYKDTIFTTRGLQAFNKMSVTSKETSQEFADALADSYGSAAQQAETQLDNLNGDLTLFDSAVSGLKIAIGEKFDGICRTFVQFGTDALGTFTEVIDGTKSIGDVLSDVGNSIVEWFGSIDWMGLAIEVKDKIINGFKTLVEEVPATLADFATSVTSFLEGVDWYAVGSQVADFIINGIKNLISLVPGTISNFCSTITSFIQSVDWHQVGSDIITFILNGIKALFTDVPAAIGEFVESIKTKITETDWLQVGSDILQGIIDGITGLFSSGVSAIGDFCSGIYEAVTGFFQTGSPSVLMMNTGQDVAQGLIDGMDGMGEGVDAELQETLGYVDAFGIQGQEEMVNAGAQAAAGISTGYSQVPTAVQNPLSGTLSNINSWGNQAGQAASTTAKTFTSNTQSGMSGLPGQVNNQLTGAMANVTSWGSKMSQQASVIAKTFVTNFTSGWANFSSQVSNKLTQITTAVNSWGTQLASAAKTIANNFVNNFVSALSNLNSQVSSKLSSVVSTVNSYGSTMTSAGNTLGSNLVQGMINGINSKSSSLYSTISSVVSKAVSTANSAAGTGSPSRYLMWTGEMMDEGLAIGLSKYSDLVNEAMLGVMGIMEMANNMEYMADVRTGNGKNANGFVRGAAINFTQNIYSQKTTAAEQQREAKYQAQR
ncbi:MAG: phage tail tape measure protein, partial [Bacteroidales bacterium]|nr:phage tail tape measure protein [Bacteroidales bacterium]